MSHDTRDDLVSAQAVERYKERQKEGRETFTREGGRQFIFVEIRGRIAPNRDNVKCEEQVVKDVGRMVRQNVTPRNSK